MASTSLRYEVETYVVPTYAEDYAGRVHYQAILLRAGQLHLLDRAWVAEELDDLGTGKFRRLERALVLVLQHMLKWDHQIKRRSRNWTMTSAVQCSRASAKVKPELQATL